MIAAGLQVGTPFPVPAITPQMGALRRSYLVETGQGLVSVPYLRRLLRELNPAVEQALTDRSFIPVYKTLLDEMNNRFPVLDNITGFYEELGATPMDEDELRYMASYIPVEVMGCGYSDLQAPLVLAKWICGDDEVNGEEIARDNLTAHAFKKMQALVGDVIVHRDQPEVPRPPRGREWAGVWKALPDLAAYVTFSCGNLFLDMDQQTMDENGVEYYPPLDIDEIRGLEHQWKEAKPVLEGIRALVADIDYPTGLETLAGALRRDRKAILKITTPKGKSLAKQWSTK